ncbi:MAG: inositol monophosphatase [Gammaproteobacteria bacterium]|nr:inositol monophosphatase [Gammaproteobacteria bacterium]
MHALLNIAVRAARAAGDHIVRQLERVDQLTVTEKRDNDFVSEVDKHAERVIIDTISRAYPAHAILAEESGARGRHDYCWIIDPLDGTTNFLHALPHFAISIAVEHRGRIEHGLVFDPLRQEIFTASRGGGAQLDGKRIRVSRRAGLRGALLGTGFLYSDLPRLDRYLRMLGVLVPGTAGFRRAGAAALDLAYVASGRLDGFWELSLKPWDVAAGSLLVREAGGMVTELNGGEDYMRSGDVVAGAPRVHREMLQRLRKVAAVSPPAEEEVQGSKADSDRSDGSLDSDDGEAPAH